MTGFAEEVIADPVGLVVRLVGNVEKQLSAEHVRDIVLPVVRARAGRRSLAQALHDGPVAAADRTATGALLRRQTADGPERRRSPGRRTAPLR